MNDVAKILRELADNTLDAGYPYYGAPETVRRGAAEIERLQAERDALLKDAERYRWLRERLSHQRCGPNVGWGTDELLPGDDPDAAIDAALATGDG
jgi:hypothetical protein